jgi:hypothetical protein
MLARGSVSLHSSASFLSQTTFIPGSLVHYTRGARV